MGHILGGWSDTGSGLTCACMTDAHRRTAAQLMDADGVGMRAALQAAGHDTTVDDAETAAQVLLDFLRRLHLPA